MYKRQIENSADSAPLIYGEFDTDLVQINGTLRVTDVMRLIPLNTAPTCSSTEKGTLYMDNATNKLRLCDGSAWIDLN